MTILLTGGSGLIGQSLHQRLAQSGYQVLSLRRTTEAKPPDGGAWWNPAAGWIAADALREVQAVVHLSGASVATRWTPSARREIVASRVDSTALLARTLATAAVRPACFICASAVGYYGDRGDERLTEESPPGEGFLADTCQAWEAAAQPAVEAGIRVVHLRLGVVLTMLGGALPKMLPPFRLGLGARLGSGRQWMSWISLPDVTSLFVTALENESLAGVYNAVAPGAVTNREFTRTLGRVLHRPAPFAVPAPVLKLALGQMGQEVLLGGQRVVPARAQEMGFPFRHLELELALQAILAKGY